MACLCGPVSMKHAVVEREVGGAEDVVAGVDGEGDVVQPAGVPVRSRV